MLELIDIVHSYDGKRLLNGISFRVEEDEVLCLLGPSGSGKSTILRIIAGLEMPLSGQVLFNGRSILDELVYKRNFGLVFQDYALFPHMNVFENIAFGLKMRDVKAPDLENKVRYALKQVGMEKFAERKVTELSGGEQQRVALARSLVVQPALLMLDEPLGALDYSLRQTLIAELSELLGKNGIPAIYVTHDQNEAMSLSDRIAILHDGRIIQSDKPEALLARPADEWTANFLGFHNFVDGTFSDDETLAVRNFGKLRTMRIPGGREQYGKMPRLLLKKGMLSGSAALHPDRLFLDAIVLRCIYRGSTYDVTLQVDENCEITVQSQEKLAAGDQVQVGYGPENVILYKTNSPD